MQARDTKVRNYIYSHFVDLQRPPSVSEMAAHLGLSRDRIIECLHRLHAEHYLVLESGKSDIRMAMPFSAVDTGIRVTVKGKTWWPNCAWDALGIPVLLNADADIEASCPDCSAPLRLQVRQGAVTGDAAIIQLEVPAARFWENVVYT